MGTKEKVAYKVVCIDDSSPFEFQVLDDVNRGTLNEVCERIAENGKKFDSARCKWLILPISCK